MRDVADTGRRAGRERPWWRAPAASPVSDREQYRAHVLAAMPVEAGGEACTLIVRRVGNRVQLLHHGVFRTAADLTGAQAVELAAMLAAASEAR